jgi:hypothetical protein
MARLANREAQLGPTWFSQPVSAGLHSTLEVLSGACASISRNQ